jgi:hypothetical protein
MLTALRSSMVRRCTCLPFRCCRWRNFASMFVLSMMQIVAAYFTSCSVRTFFTFIVVWRFFTSWNFQIVVTCFRALKNTFTNLRSLQYWKCERACTCRDVECSSSPYRPFHPHTPDARRHPKDCRCLRKRKVINIYKPRRYFNGLLVPCWLGAFDVFSADGAVCPSTGLPEILTSVTQLLKLDTNGR